MRYFPIEWMDYHRCEYDEVTELQRRIEEITGILKAVAERQTIMQAVGTAGSEDRAAQLVVGFLDVYAGHFESIVQAAASPPGDQKIRELEEERDTLIEKVDTITHAIADDYRKLIAERASRGAESADGAVGLASHLSTVELVTIAKEQDRLLFVLLDAAEELMGQTEIKWVDKLPDRELDSPFINQFFYTASSFHDRTGGHLLPDGPVLHPEDAVARADMHCQLEAEFAPLVTRPAENERWATSLVPLTDLDGSGLAADTHDEHQPIWYYDKTETLRPAWDSATDLLHAINAAIRHGALISNCTFDRESKKWNLQWPPPQ